ncbi:hypothetical protein ACFLTW_04560 [Chloroflexota bacterium]
MEVWEKVFIKDGGYLETTHGKIVCVYCHGGDNAVTDKDLAHSSIETDPSEVSCNACHEDITPLDDTSLHATLSGMRFPLEERGGVFGGDSPLGEAFDNHCNTCHTTCGQCHVSRPEETDGGLVSGHEFRETPSMQYNCTGCHGSRVGDEYLGNNEGVEADLHWTQATMTCTKCHSDELHGTGQPIDTRYHNPETTKCEDCHQDVITGTENNPQHMQHLDDLQCQVCHATTYKNCYNCHVAKDQNGLPYRTSDPSEMQFKIGANPLVTPSRPYEYVVLRHVPISPDTFSYYGDDLLPNFDALPTWKYATPHNIQLNTSQNSSCDACHGNAELFLMEQDVSPEEREANQNIILKEIPGP